MSSPTESVASRNTLPDRPWNEDPSPFASAPRKTAEHGVLREAFEPQAMRVWREGTEPVVVPLIRYRSYTLGRSSVCDLVFPDEHVSRFHGRLEVDSEQCVWVYRDQGSSNGSYIEEYGRPDDPPRLIRNGKKLVVRAGEVLHLGNSKSRVELLAELPRGMAPADAEGSGWRSPAAQRLARAIGVASRHDLPVFLLGESGTGKTWAAHEIHRQRGCKGPFVAINCGQLPSSPTNLASELLGHVKGAFTDAHADRVGKLFHADNGTLFLDEVESLPPEAQAFLLDLLEGTGDLAPLGASPGQRLPRPHFRLISASKVKLAQSKLRRDLAQRLASGDIVLIPSLEERREDLPAMVDAFLRELRDEGQLQAQLTADALVYLTEQPWPGQIRELRATVRTVVMRASAEPEVAPSGKRKLVIGTTAIRAYLDERRAAFGVDEAPPAPPTAVPAEPPARRKALSELDREDLKQALASTGGNKAQAARLLGIALNTLKKKMREAGLESAGA
ncbi:MAG TPA: sigma 54-interacting transcriptional regulator [Myxococcaceae bacterium]|nr:sigma 54-interacting transcriptional regulator [Myxococcaceae bacterium]